MYFDLPKINTANGYHVIYFNMISVRPNTPSTAFYATLGYLMTPIVMDHVTKNECIHYKIANYISRSNLSYVQ